MGFSVFGFRWGRYGGFPPSPKKDFKDFNHQTIIIFIVP